MRNAGDQQTAPPPKCRFTPRSSQPVPHSLPAWRVRAIQFFLRPVAIRAIRLTWSL